MRLARVDEGRKILLFCKKEAKNFCPFAGVFTFEASPKAHIPN
jgi:hypothetical protein